MVCSKKANLTVFTCDTSAVFATSRGEIVTNDVILQFTTYRLQLLVYLCYDKVLTALVMFVSRSPKNILYAKLNSGIRSVGPSLLPFRDVVKRDLNSRPPIKKMCTKCPSMACASLPDLTNSIPLKTIIISGSLPRCHFLGTVCLFNSWLPTTQSSSSSSPLLRATFLAQSLAADSAGRGRITDYSIA